MIISEAIHIYVTRMKALGFDYKGIKADLDSFCLFARNKRVSTISSEDVTSYLNRSPIGTGRRREKYDRLARFFRYLVLVGKMATAPLPKPPRRVKTSFLPYIYTRAEIRKMLERSLVVQAVTNPNQRNVLDADTVRRFLLFLYGTGVTVREALNLEWNNVDLRRREISVTKRMGGATRTIPIGSDATKLLWRQRRTVRQTRSDYCFQTIDGRKIAHPTLVCTFRRIREMCGIIRPEDAKHQPRMHDLRITFAVHRLSSWYNAGQDASVMIPALAAYMGFSTLSIMRYLFLVPEHYRRAADIHL
jgi:integrase/recombinase XerD